jgi:hypothetical protein
MPKVLHSYLFVHGLLFKNADKVYRGNILGRYPERELDTAALLFEVTTGTPTKSYSATVAVAIRENSQESQSLTSTGTEVSLVS